MSRSPTPFLHLTPPVPFGYLGLRWHEYYDRFVLASGTWGEPNKRIPRPAGQVLRPDAPQRAPGHRRQALSTHPIQGKRMYFEYLAGIAPCQERFPLRVWG